MTCRNPVRLADCKSAKISSKVLKQTLLRDSVLRSREADGGFEVS